MQAPNRQPLKAATLGLVQTGKHLAGVLAAILVVMVHKRVVFPALKQMLIVMKAALNLLLAALVQTTVAAHATQALGQQALGAAVPKLVVQVLKRVL